jgi:hypothetical protein
MGHPPRQFGRQAASGRSLIPALPAAGKLRRAGVSSVFEQKYIMEYLHHDKTEKIIQAFFKVCIENKAAEALVEENEFQLINSQL